MRRIIMLMSALMWVTCGYRVSADVVLICRSFVIGTVGLGLVKCKQSPEQISVTVES
jgi:hypothetical protein